MRHHATHATERKKKEAAASVYACVRLYTRAHDAVRQVARVSSVNAISFLSFFYRTFVFFPSSSIYIIYIIFFRYVILTTSSIILFFFFFVRDIYEYSYIWSLKFLNWSRNSRNKILFSHVFPLFSHVSRWNLEKLSLYKIYFYRILYDKNN